MRKPPFRAGLALAAVSLLLNSCAPDAAPTPSGYAPTTLDTASGPVQVVRAPNGTLIAGGDVALGDQPAQAYQDYFSGPSLHDLALHGSALQGLASGVPTTTRLWAGNIIPYIINKNVDPKYLPLIESTVQEYATRTNLRLVKRTNQRYYVEIAGANNPSFCGLASSVGFYSTSTVTSSDRRTYGLSSGSTHYIILNNTDASCAKDLRTVVHEFGHISGLRHEHSRPDRDKYIRIDLAALDGDPLYTGAFNAKDSTSGRLNAYDLGSVMHYEAFFRKNGKQIIYPLDTTFPLADVGGRTLSALDVQMLNTLYPNAPK